MREHRSSQRKRRRTARMPSVALIGYTNAGKSTLLNSLTAAGVLAENSLFATLDPTVRRIVLPTGKLALLSDTVGFIQKLPTQLVDAFRATLEEIKVHLMGPQHSAGTAHFCVWELAQHCCAGTRCLFTCLYTILVSPSPYTSSRPDSNKEECRELINRRS